MENTRLNNQNPAPEEPTSAVEEIIIFLAALPTRTRAVFNFIRTKKTAIFNKSKPTIINNETAPTTPIVTSTKTTDQPEQEKTEENPFPPITRKNFFKHPIFWARFLGYAIPLSFLLYVFYLNYLPFGYHKTFTINVGSTNDTTPSEFYLEQSKDLSIRMISSDAIPYRILNGVASIVFKPNALLKKASITIRTSADGDIYFLPPNIKFEPNSIKWDFDWDFSTGVPKSLINSNNRAFAQGNGIFFDGSAKMSLPKSRDVFENGPFSIYVEWNPSDDLNSYQQIIGHFNWELFQNDNAVSFRVGRMNNADGVFYVLNQPITDKEVFFNHKHSALITYNPSNGSTTGFIEMFVDGKFSDRKYIFFDKIFNDYNQNIDLSLGKSEYDVAHYYKGIIYKIKLINKPLLQQSKQLELRNFSEKSIRFQITSNTPTKFTNIELEADQN